MLNEKRVVIEFLETGGFINLEHDHLLLNAKLYRTNMQQFQSIAVMVNGLFLFILSVVDIYLENKPIDGGEDEEEEGAAAAGGADATEE